MPPLQIRYVSYARCPNCGAEIIRDPECTVAICKCDNPYIELPLKPAVLLRDPTLKRFEDVAKAIGVPLEILINGILEIGADMVMRGEIKLPRG